MSAHAISVPQQHINSAVDPQPIAHVSHPQSTCSLRLSESHLGDLLHRKLNSALRDTVQIRQ